MTTGDGGSDDTPRGVFTGVAGVPAGSNGRGTYVYAGLCGASVIGRRGCGVAVPCDGDCTGVDALVPLAPTRRDADVGGAGADGTEGD
jgi:hypothetical protein